MPVTEYIESFRTALLTGTLGSMRYSYSVFLVPHVANRASAADAAVQFVKVDEAAPEVLERLQSWNVLIKEKHIPIANLDFHKPSDVVAAVAAQIPWKVQSAPPGMRVATLRRATRRWCAKARRD